MADQHIKRPIDQKIEAKVPVIEAKDALPEEEDTGETNDESEGNSE